MKITNLRTNHLENPIGYQMDTISLSWTVEEARGTCTKLARVEIAEDPGFASLVWDSGESDQLDEASCVPALKTKERTRYFWRVSVQDDAGDAGVSETAFFETAPEKIGGKWITAPYEKEAHGLYKKTWESEKAVKSARLYISGMGLYEAYLNGEKVGDEYLTPFYNDYNHWIQFQSYDVTELVKTGGNELGVMLGNGWYKGRFGFIDKLDCLYGDTQAMICELALIYEDGSEERICSDESFSCHRSPVLSSSIYDGEEYDANRQVKGFCLPAVKEETCCSEDGWTAAVAADEKIQKWSGILVPRRSLPLTLHEELKPVEVIHTPAGETVLDFGQNLTGFFSFVCHEPKGTKIHLQFGEILQDDNFYNENLRTAKEEYTYISDGTDRIVRPHFTFYGYRFMKVEGISDLEAADFKAQALYSQMAPTGKIETSNPKVNRLFLNALWGQKGNFVDVPTDCPQRDERMGWTGDAQVFCATASFNLYTPGFYAKYLYDMLGEQKELGGSVPHVVPDILDQIADIQKAPRMAHGSCAWADVATVIPWTMYVFFGDKSLLADQYENMKLWIDYIHSVDEEKCGGKRLWNYGFHFADWLALDNYHKGSSFGGTDPYYIASAYYLYSAELTAKAAAVLGKEEDAAYYAKLAEEVRQAMKKEYFTETGRIAVDTQTAMVLALKLDIVPETAKERLTARLKEKLDEENVHLTTGFVGTPYLCPVLSENGMIDYAYTLLLNEDFPSWLYEVNMGATTIWERWNSVLPDGKISDTGMNSLNHYSYGSIVEWMYRYMCGLNPDEEKPGFKKFTLKPYPDARFDHASAEYQSVYGKIESGWKKTESGWHFAVKVPFDTTADFVLSDAVRGAKKVTVKSADGEALTALSEELQGKGSITLLPGSYVIETEA